MEFVRKCIEALPAMCVAMDGDGRVLACSPSAAARWHLAPGGSPSREFPWMARPEELHRADGICRERTIAGDSPGEDGRLKVSSRWIESGGSGFHLVVFVPEGTRGMDQDWFRMVVESAPEGMLLVDSRGRIVFCNGETERVFGYALSELAGRNLEMLLPERYRPAHEGHRQGFLADPKARTMGSGRDLYGLHKDGNEIPIEIGLTPLRREGEQFVLASIVDISQRKKMEEKFIQTQKLEGLGVLAGGIAHDFNNILAAIQGFAELIRLRKPDDSTIAGFVENILTGSRRGAELVRQMLAYAGKSRFQLERIDLRDLVAEMVKFLEVSISKSAVLTLQLDAKIPEVQGDASQIRQVLMNLLVNASEALGGQPGAIAVRLGCVSDLRAEDGLQAGFEPDRSGYVYLEVEDTGCGVPDEIRRSLFDPFFTTKTIGRGLGLSSVLGIAKSHHGGVGLVSSPGAGTRFRVYFPVDGLDEPASEPESSSPTAETPARSILLVDDEVPVRTATAAMLVALGYRVVMAADGMEAVEIYSRHPRDFELVLLDMTMPRRDGIQTMRTLKPIYPWIRAILTSGYGEPRDLELSPATGFVGFLRKPYSFEELRIAIEAALADRPTGG